jgi:dephospho-CoA kinase
MNTKVIIGLTGNIGTGKSVVLRMLAELGAEAIDADEIARDEMQFGKPVFMDVVAHFGRYILTPEGEIDREKLAKLVFMDAEALKRLEEIVHPAVSEQIRKKVEHTSADVIAIEAIKLLESDLLGLCQQIWVVTAPESVQLQRLVKKRKMSREDALLRIQAQPPASAKLAHAQVVIDNSKDIKHTWLQVKNHYPNPAAGTSEAQIELKQQEAEAENKPLKSDFGLLFKEALAADIRPGTAQLPPLPAKSLPKAVTAAADLPPTASALEAETARPQPVKAPAVVKAPSIKIERRQLSLRRAKRSDLENLTSLILQQRISKETLSQEQMHERFFKHAYLLAEAGGQLWGAIGWSTENLVAGVDDFYVRQPDMWNVVGESLLEKLEEELRVLSCEVVLIFLHNETNPAAYAFLEQRGYQRQKVEDLIPDWRIIAKEIARPELTMMMKKLLERRILQPI